MQIHPLASISAGTTFHLVAMSVAVKVLLRKMFTEAALTFAKPLVKAQETVPQKTYPNQSPITRSC